MKELAFSLWIFFLTCVAAVLSSDLEKEGLFKDGTIADLLKGENRSEDVVGPNVKYCLQKSLDPEDVGCYLNPGQNDSLQECGFNATAKTILVIHGWTMSGMFEKWLQKLVSAIQEREKEANVLVVDWINLAHQVYPDAVNHTKTVGHDIAKFLEWLKDELNLPLQNVHMIGYSLGAHVAGYAGNYVNGTIGRITGLDPAGPMFEGVDSDSRLSPDDADFVDVLHTYTREALGVSIGIQQPVGHIDIYPNGGDSQPGCGLSDILGTMAYRGFGEAVKCEHERSVYLFIDSLLNKDHQSFAYRCTDPSRFKKGICLSCRKNRCNNLGYNIKKMRNRRNSKMYLKTRADMPFGGYHYQMKMHVFSKADGEDKDPTFFVKLYGAHNDTKDHSVDLPDKIGLNFTNSFLVFTEEDIGDLLKIKLSWEGAPKSWFSIWKKMKSVLYSGGTKENQVLEVRRIRVKCGETQKKFTFCAEDPTATKITPGNEITFVKCRDGWEVKPRKRLHY
ncbi:endothelial lipase-like [Acipenser ruthenus]|uniref:endothelial lipase-like n=1 Tax=Acipenser ruthenus TaxID=7906 RepID=UPI00145BA3FD|nr:endothelial lipase-like [Acipenser ruthenus]